LAISNNYAEALIANGKLLSSGKFDN